MAEAQHPIIFTPTVHVQGITSLHPELLLQLSLGETLKIWTSACTHNMQKTGQVSAHA